MKKLNSIYNGDLNSGDHPLLRKIESLSKEQFEHPGLRELHSVVSEVADLTRVIRQSHETASVQLDQLRLLVERNLQVTQDLTLLIERESRDRYLAYHDDLTKLPNRRLLRDRLKQALAQAQRHKKCVGVLLLDLDGFKDVNDRLGHLAGDQLLQQVAKRLTDCVRVGDTVCRYGGDEFVIMLPDLDDDFAAWAVTDKIHAALDETYFLSEKSIDATASIGLAIYPNDGKNYNALIKYADNAMYAVKNKGSSPAQQLRRSGSASQIST
jgi:diguanylate cyclase